MGSESDLYKLILNIINVIVRKTIKCRIFEPTKLKYDLLNQEYNNFQIFMKLESNDLDWIADKIPIYSVYRQQARLFYANLNSEREYPISIRKDIIEIKKTNNVIAKYWVRIRIKTKWGGLWLPLKPHTEFPDNFNVCESKLLKKNNDFYIYITIQKEVEIRKSYSSILAIDIGEKVLATVLLNGRPIFYGREIRGIRRHYAWLRKRLGERKLLKVIKRLSDKEKRTVNLKLHEISKQIVSLACQHNSLIVIGNLKGIRKSTRGKKFNRSVSNMPHFRLTQLITYKANWLGFQIIKIDERGTSHICSKCGSEGKRINQGLFKCLCGYQANADFNAVKNIEKRSLEYISKNGVSVQT